MTVSYSTLSQSFSKVKDLDVKALGELIGGKVKQNIDAKIFTNGCAIRMSYAFNYSGLPISKSDGAVSSGADGKWYFYRVSDVIRFVKDWITDTPVVGTRESDFSGKEGIIVFSGCGWSDATGHVDLFSGSRVESLNGNYFGTCSEAELYVVNF